MAIPFLSYIFIALAILELFIVFLSRASNYNTLDTLKYKKKSLALISVLVLTYLWGLVQTEQISTFLIREFFGLLVIIIVSFQISLYKYQRQLYLISFKIYRQVILFIAILGLFKFFLLLSGIEIPFLFTKNYYPIGSALGSDQNFFALALIIGILIELFILTKDKLVSKFKFSSIRVFLLLGAVITSTSRRALILLVILMVIMAFEWIFKFYQRDQRKSLLIKLYKPYIALLFIFIGVFTSIFGISDNLKNQIIHSISITPNQFKKNIAALATDYFSFTDSTQNYFKTYSLLWEQDLSKNNSRLSISESLFDKLFLAKKSLNLIDNPNFLSEAKGWKFNKNSRVFFFSAQNHNAISIDSKTSSGTTSINTKFRVNQGDSIYITFFVNPTDTISKIKALISAPEINNMTEIPISDLVVGVWNSIEYSTKYTRSGFVSFSIYNSIGNKYYLSQVSANTSKRKTQPTKIYLPSDSTLLKQGFYSVAKKVYQINQILDNKLEASDKDVGETKDRFKFNPTLSTWNQKGAGSFTQLNNDSLSYYYIEPYNNWITLSDDVVVRKGDTIIFSAFIDVVQWNQKQHFILRNSKNKVIKRIASRKMWEGDNKWHLLKYKYIALQDDTIEFRISNGIDKKTVPKSFWYGIQASEQSIWKSKLPLPKIICSSDFENLKKKKDVNLLSNYTFNSGFADWYRNGNPNIYILYDTVSKSKPILLEGKYSGDGLFTFADINKDTQYSFSAYVKVIQLKGKSFIRTKSNNLLGYSTKAINPNWEKDNSWHLITQKIRVQENTSIPLLISVGKNSVLLLKDIKLAKRDSKTQIADTISPNPIFQYNSDEVLGAMRLYNLNMDTIPLFQKQKELPDYLKKLSADALYSSRIKRWIYALEIYFNNYSIQEKIIGNGFDYLRKFGAVFHMDEEVVDYPHNPILSTLLYSGFLGFLFYIFFLLSSIIAYVKNYNKFNLLFASYLAVMFFALFSGNSHFTIPIFALLSLIPFLTLKKKP